MRTLSLLLFTITALLALFFGPPATENGLAAALPQQAHLLARKEPEVPETTRAAKSTKTEKTEKAEKTEAVSKSGTGNGKNERVWTGGLCLTSVLCFLSPSAQDEPFYSLDQD